MTYVTCWLAAKKCDQLLNPTLGSRVWAAFTFYHGSGTEPAIRSGVELVLC